MAVNTIDPTKPILGYTLKQRIGIGGFGEVWSAEAPGGLPKAVKFIFGYHDEKRAQAELKSLNRIRDVRHPFLLSLERIDIVDGQMVVITELADMCLKTRFEQCVQSGLNGIPRAELLGYLADAAGALDYIREEFRLQHLDVKPENLLVVSGHVKVADFGLVKDIHDGTQSMMSGLTPAYAPPELFDGRPSKLSDQYSLAILYQEMLTGVRPFSGKTAAQLASQHINDRPLLKPLPREDQAIVSRALSKDPELRYPSCAALIEELSTGRAQQARGTQPRTRKKLRDGRRRSSPTSPSSTIPLEGTRDCALSPREVVKLEPIEFVAKEAKFRPTLIVGLGRTGTRILQQIRKKVRQRNGELEALPAIRFMGIDTDPRNLHASYGTESRDELRSSELFAMPLRKPEDYRVDGKMHLSWLSRRWIYNVPKSLQTEGIRPLGRLAFATHVKHLAIRLRQVISELVSTEHVANTAASLELDPAQQPRIVIVGSIGGGTCSGVAIDVAYLIRAILREFGVLDEEVVGVFTHSANGMGRQRELVIANALVFLNELYHFTCVEEYPGDATCSIPPSTDGTATFASTYLADLGDDLCPSDYDDQLDNVAEYIYLSTATACATYFDSCRRLEKETSGLPLRSLGLCRSTGSRGDVASSCSMLLGDHVFQVWNGDDESCGTHVAGVANEVLHQVTAQTEQMVGFVHEALQHVLGDPISSIGRPIAESFNAEDREDSYRKVVQHVLDVFGSFHGITDETRKTKLAAGFESLRNHFVSDRLPKLTERILEIVDAPGTRLAGATSVDREVTKRLHDQTAQLGCMIENATEDIVRKMQELLKSHDLTAQSVPDFAQSLAEVLLQRYSLECVKSLTEALLPYATETQRRLAEITDQLDTVMSARRDRLRPEESTTNEPSDQFVAEVRSRLLGRLSKLRHRVEQQLQHNVLDHHGGLRAVLDDAELRYQFVHHFDEAAWATIIEQLKEICLEDCFASPELDLPAFANWMIEESTPHLLDCGGTIRLMCAIPDRSKPMDAVVNEIGKLSEHGANVVPATLGELVVCAEVEHIPLDNIAMHLIHGRPDSLEFATRLHTRTDISWTHISAMR